MNVIVVEQLTKIYQTGMKKGGIVAVNELSLAIEQGEIFGLLGPNGAGKTTLFKILLGITQATSGLVAVSGLTPANPASRQKLGYLPENHRFPDHLTGHGLLELTGRMYGMGKGEIDARIGQLLELVGMAKWGTTKIRQYSKGMLQRIGLAQAMVSNPDILLLDEPTDGVDPIGKVEIRQALEQIKSEGKTIVLNSHLLSEVEEVADRVAILHEGKLVRLATIEELSRRGRQFEIECSMGDRLFTLPEDVGKITKVSSSGLIVDLDADEQINDVIDLLRQKRISIRSVMPVKVTLEQSFMEAIGTTIPGRSDGGQQ